MSSDKLPPDEIDWNLIKVFHQIVEAGGVTAAAKKLARNQPAVSLALRRFEERIGTRLCRRGPGGFSLLDEGEIVADICRQVDQLIRALPLRLSEASENLKGVLHIRMLEDIVCDELDETLRSMRRNYPNIQLHIDIHPEESVVRGVQRNDVDIGVASDRIQIADLQFDLLFREVHQAYCGRGFHLYGKKIADLAALADEPFLLGGVDEPDALKRYRIRTGIGGNVTARSEDLSEIRRLTLLGLGIGFMPHPFVAADVAAGRLWSLTPGATDWGIDIFLITNRRSPRQLMRRLFFEEFAAVKNRKVAASSPEGSHDPAPRDR